MDEVDFEQMSPLNYEDAEWERVGVFKSNEEYIRDLHHSWYTNKSYVKGTLMTDLVQNFNALAVSSRPPHTPQHEVGKLEQWKFLGISHP